MTGIDIDEGRRLAAAADAHEGAFVYRDRVVYREWLRINATAMFDAIETGRQWETIARRLATVMPLHKCINLPTYGCPCRHCLYCEQADVLAAFRDFADRTPEVGP